MKALGEYDYIMFPENPEEAKNWEKDFKYIHTTALARCVLVYAHTRIEGAWCAYIDSVPGENHDNEWQAVRDNGDKLSEKIALAIFPEFTGIPYAR